MRVLEAGIAWFFIAIIVVVLIANPAAVTAAGNAVSNIGTGLIGGFANFAGRG